MWCWVVLLKVATYIALSISLHFPLFFMFVLSLFFFLFFFWTAMQNFLNPNF